MKGSGTVYSAVKKASRVSKRSGKWATFPEIKGKIPKSPVFKEAVLPILRHLVKNEDIEKRKNFSMWRPQGMAGGGGIGGSSRTHRGTGDDIARSAGAAAAASAARSATSSAVRYLF